MNLANGNSYGIGPVQGSTGTQAGEPGSTRGGLFLHAFDAGPAAGLCRLGNAL